MPPYYDVDESSDDDSDSNPWANLSGSEKGASDAEKQEKDTADDFSDGVSTSRSDNTSTGGGSEGDEEDEVMGSPTEYMPSGHTLIPDGWQEAFDPSNESSRITVQILNAHIEHLRWTYRCLNAHYTHCVNTHMLLSIQEGVLLRALYCRNAEGELQETMEA